MGGEYDNFAFAFNGLVTGEFRDKKEDRILERLIQTIEERKMITKETQKQWNLNKFFEEASQRHDLKREVKEMTNGHTNTINDENGSEIVKCHKKIK